MTGRVMSSCERSVKSRVWMCVMMKSALGDFMKACGVESQVWVKEISRSRVKCVYVHVSEVSEVCVRRRFKMCMSVKMLGDVREVCRRAEALGYKKIRYQSKEFYDYRKQRGLFRSVLRL